MSSDDRDDAAEPPYEVGYCKPPRIYRFQKGRSGNPSGRPKRRDHARDVRKVLDEPVGVRRGGRSRKLALGAAVVLQIRAKALQGDAKAASQILEMLDIEGAVQEPEPAPAPRGLSRESALLVARCLDFKEILDVFVERGWAEVTEDNRIRLREEMFERMFGPDWKTQDDSGVRRLRNWMLAGGDIHPLLEHD